MDERDNLVTILFAENPICLLLQVLEGDNFVGINEGHNVFNDLLVQEEIGRPVVKQTKQAHGHFGVPNIESIMELRGTECQSVGRPFGKV